MTHKIFGLSCGIMELPLTETGKAEGGAAGEVGEGEAIKSSVSSMLSSD